MLVDEEAIDKQSWHSPERSLMLARYAWLYIPMADILCSVNCLEYQQVTTRTMVSTAFQQGISLCLWRSMLCGAMELGKTGTRVPLGTSQIHSTEWSSASCRPSRQLGFERYKQYGYSKFPRPGMSTCQMLC
jgi:hypothetical protein